MPAFIHNRAKHILAKNPKMEKSQAFAIATQQSHKLGKSPKGYGTSEGKRHARSKYRAPRKSYMQTANPGNLDSTKLAMVMHSAFTDELDQIAKEAALGPALKAVGKSLTKDIPGTKPWVLGRGGTQSASAGGAARLRSAGRLRSAPKTPGGAWDVSAQARKMGL